MNRKKQPSCCRRFREERIRPLSEADVLKPYEVACALSKNRKTTRAWLAEHELIRMVLGSPRVIWGDVLQLIRSNRGIAFSKKHTIQQAKLPLTDEF